MTGKPRFTAMVCLGIVLGLASGGVPTVMGAPWWAALWGNLMFIVGILFAGLAVALAPSKTDQR